MKGDIAERRGFSIRGSGVEDQISEITIFKLLLYILLAGRLNHSIDSCFRFIITITGV